MIAANIEQALALLPEFSAIVAAEIVPQLSNILERNRSEIDALIAHDSVVTWANFVVPLEEIGDRLSRFFSPISHLHSVADNEELRAAYNEALPLLSQYASELAQSDGLFKAFSQLRDGVEFDTYSAAQRKVIDNALRDFRLGGIALDESARERFRDISQQLSLLSTRFEEHVLDATQAFEKDIDDPANLAGIPASTLALLRQNAAKDDKQTHRLSLDFPCYMPVMTYCDNRELRREMYEAYVTRASERGPHAGQFDNSTTIDDILALRHELANILGFANYAEYSLETKMAKSVEAVVKFLGELAEHSRAAAVRDYAQLEDFALKNLDIKQLEPWDVAYCAEKLRQQAYDFSQEELRPYFPASGVVDGLFKTVNRLFDITVTELDGIDTWHPDVGVYRIDDKDGNLRGLFYLDLYAREDKRGGAWMDECVVRRTCNNTIQTPVAYLTCNFTPPVDGKSALLTHDEVSTLFHEFGHGLHHMLTLVDHASVAGINGVPWDGVELPSQFLENWCFEREALDVIGAHVETGEKIPADLFRRMRAARNFQSGMQMLRQVEFSLFDFRLHAEYTPGMSVQSLLDDVRAQVAVVLPPEYNRFQHGFSHIFAGGYAAGYYSYKWAEVLSADAFSRFEEEGIFNHDTGASFRQCILERGGAEDIMELFEQFRGRAAKIEPLLRHAGLTS